MQSGVRGEELGRDDAGDLPVPDRGVLALGFLGHAREGAGRLLKGREVDVVGRIERAVDVEKPELGEVGDVEVGRGRTGAESVGALVAVDGGIGHLADAETVEHDHEDAFCHEKNLI